MYSNKQTLKHFEVIRDRYFQSTHRYGKTFVSDPMVLQKIMEQIITDTELLKQFQKLTKFHDDDLSSVWRKFNSRFLTLVGNEICRQFMVDLKKSKDGELEQLRQVKVQAIAKVKQQSQTKPPSESHSKPQSQPKPPSQSHCKSQSQPFQETVTT